MNANYDTKFLENEEIYDYSKLYHNMKSEIKSNYIINALGLILVGILLITIIFLPNLYVSDFQIQTQPRIFHKIINSYTFNWTLYSFCVFMTIFLIKNIYSYINPALLHQLNVELKVFELKIEKRNYFNLIIYIFFNFLGMVILILIDLEQIQFRDTSGFQLMRFILFMTILFCSLLPIISNLITHKYRINLVKNYRIFLRSKYSIFSTKNIETIKIFLFSTPLGTRKNKKKLEIYEDICEKRWLNRKIIPFWNLVD